MQATGKRSDGHEAEGQQEAGAAAAMVEIGAQDDGAERTHEESGAEGGEREHQGAVFAAAGKKSAGDGRGVDSRRPEIVISRKFPLATQSTGQKKTFAGWR